MVTAVALYLSIRFPQMLLKKESSTAESVVRATATPRIKSLQLNEMPDAAGTPQPLLELSPQALRERHDALEEDEWEQYKITLMGQRVEWMGRVVRIYGNGSQPERGPERKHDEQRVSSHHSIPRRSRELETR